MTQEVVEKPKGTRNGANSAEARAANYKVMPAILVVVVVVSTKLVVVGVGVIVAY
jgi:hypothetical protein